MPSRPLSRTSFSATPRPSAAASPSISAVPEGASTLWWWCASITSMSKSSSSAAATRLVNCTSRLTPRLMLPARTMTQLCDAGCSSAICASVMPVVPMTWATPESAQSAENASVASGAVKSITTSAAAMALAASSVATTPLAAPPIACPTSCPTQSWPLRSMAAARCTPLVSAMVRISI